MPIVIGKSVNFLQTKFTSKAGQIYPQGVNLLPVENPCPKPKPSLTPITYPNSSTAKCGHFATSRPVLIITTGLPLPISCFFFV